MSLYRRTDSPHWWVKIGHSGRTIQHSTGTEDKAQAREYHDKLKASLWEQERLGVKPRRSWKEAVIRWLAETSEKVTHGEDIRKLRWLDSFLGKLMLDEITLDVIDGVKTEKLKTASKACPLPCSLKSGCRDVSGAPANVRATVYSAVQGRNAPGRPLMSVVMGRFSVNCFR